MKLFQTSAQTSHAAAIDTRSSSIPGDAAGLIFAAIGLVATWQERWSQRRHLSQLDDRLLRDIGLDPVEARREARKPFWTA